MVALVVIWGLNLTFVKIALPVLPPLAFNALRFAGATIVLLVVLRFVEGPQRLDGGEWPGLLALGFVGHSLYQILFISGLALTTAGNSSVILATVPLFVALLGAAFKVERVRVRTWIGIFLAFGGLVLLVSGRRALVLGGRTVLGDLLMLLCTVCWASYTVFSRPFLGRFSPLALTTLTMTLGSPLIVLTALPQLLHQRWGDVTWQAWAVLGYSTIIAIAIGYVIWYRSVQAVGGSRTAVYSNLIPLVAVISSWVLLGESLNVVQVVGAIVALTGVSLAQSSPMVT